MIMKYLKRTIVTHLSVVDAYTNARRSIHIYMIFSYNSMLEYSFEHFKKEIVECRNVPKNLATTATNVHTKENFFTF